MSGYRNSLAALLGLALLSVPGAGLAQGGPVPLIPGLRGGPGPAAEPGAAGGPTGAPAPGLQVERLGAVDPAGIGLLRQADGGLPRSFWHGTERAQIERLVAGIKPTPSPTALNLARRLLLSEADLPAGEAGQPGLLATRVDRLIAIGDPDSAYRLARLAPSDAAATARAVDAAWLAERQQDACSTLASVPDAGRDAGWSKAFAFCRVLAKDLPGANLQAGLLRERGGADPVFLALMAQLSGYGDNKPIDIKSPTPLQLAMAKVANKPVTAATVDAAPPAGARLLAETEAEAPEIRLRAAERAFVYGAAPVENLRAAYGKGDIPAKDIAAALAAKSAGDARLRAALYQGVQRASDADRVKTLTAALARLRGREGGLDIRLAMAHLDSVLAVQPAPETIGLAPSAVRLLLAAGQEAPAEQWEQQLNIEGRGGSVEAAREAIRLLPLLAIASGERLEAADLRDWVDAWRAGGPVEGFEARAVALLSALQGLGREVPGDVWGKLATAGGSTVGRRPNVATMQAMRTAAQNARIGETIAYVLLALDGESPAALEPDALSYLLDALVRIGMEREARRLALEAAIGRGL